MVSGIMTALLLVMFLGTVGWAYSRRRVSDYEEAALLPLHDAPREKQP
ncbi:cbb3-type cytochrome oxidase subunit 3 [Tahibacter amnicola]|uniref:Cbb3-type cytochrome c oxidase subunit 3 n=1 Tax=Tahibacter amnicola TaxID=2976241 RepID=A0ABY6B9X1_9GAMM|nr:cbb3-type cytochrome c oxidase subunit 3 [Tahibacter amnicola]UXI66474.1 cbb3-type cytochrome c oxidase subunit 3 [Tahibacter amnicola]